MSKSRMREMHDEVLDRVARELVSEGYDVMRDPSPLLLPAKLAALGPDLVARRGDENVIVEVKLTPDPKGAEQVRALARAVEACPGWHFRLVTAPRPPDAETLTVDQILGWTEEAERLIGEGHREAGLILLLAAAEATGRRLAEAEGIRVQAWHPAAMLRELVHQGLMTNADLDLLDQARVRRNLLVHGLAGEPLDPGWLSSVVAAVRRLIGEILQPSGSPVDEAVAAG